MTIPKICIKIGEVLSSITKGRSIQAAAILLTFQRLFGSRARSTAAIFQEEIWKWNSFAMEILHSKLKQSRSHFSGAICFAF